MKETAHSSEVFVDFNDLKKPYDGPDINQKFPGEDDQLWCQRCNTHHRRGAPWRVEHERMIQKMAKKLADRIDADASMELNR